jgi:hypothetical protein
MASDRLEAQRAHFASDAFLVERAAIWRDQSPEACLAATAEECATAAWLLERLDPETRERAIAPEPLPSDTVALLVQLRAQRRSR